MADRGIDAVRDLVEGLWSRKAELKNFEALLKEISVYMGEIAEHATNGEMTNRDKALVDALRAVVVNTPDAPDVKVTVEAPTVNVEAPNVTVVIPDQKGWTVTVKSRDGNDRPSVYSIDPKE